MDKEDFFFVGVTAAVMSLGAAFAAFGDFLPFHHFILHYWPFPSAAICILWLLYKFISRNTSLKGRSPSTKTSAWYFWIPLCIYSVHMFEEHGIDIFGRYFAFHDQLCRALGFGASPQCPADEPFLFSVNVVAVLGCLTMAGALGGKHPHFFTMCLGVIFINGPVHIVSSVKALHLGAQPGAEMYNSGLLTALVFFVPWTLWTIFGSKSTASTSKWSLVGLTAVVGILQHVILVLSLKMHGSGMIDSAVNCLIEVPNGLIPIPVYLLWNSVVNRKSHKIM